MSKNVITFAKMLAYAHFKLIFMTKQRKYKITNKLIANWFDYSSERSYNSSKGKKSMEKGINSLIKHIEQQLIAKLSG